MARPLSPTIRRELVVVGALLVAATAVFWTTRLDLAAADLFREPCCAWPLAEREPWASIYRFGVFAGVLLAGAALVAFTLTFWYPDRLLHLRRPALFLVLVVALGPGLVVNTILKDNWGRPRPREVVELGGVERYVPVWAMGRDRAAKSFPCGHCSMGFYLGVPWLVLKRRRPRAAWGFLAAGLVGGGLLGAARMMAGGHFLSDVVWAGGMTWLVALALYQAMDLDRAPAPAAAARDRKRARLVTALGGGALALLTLGVLVATPYASQKTFALTAAQVAAGPPVYEVALEEATVRVAAGPGFEASYDVRAFGLPTSKVRFAARESPEAFRLGVQDMGLFTERRLAVALTLPAAGPRPVRLRVGKGTVTLDLEGFAPGARLDVEVGEGEVRVRGAAALERGDATVRVAKGAVIRE